MRTVTRKLVALFVDSPWLAAVALAWTACCAILLRAGLPSALAGVLLPFGLALSLAFSVRSATRGRPQVPATRVPTN